MSSDSNLSPSHRLLGKRLPKGSLDPTDFLGRVQRIHADLNQKLNHTYCSLKDLKTQIAEECRFYYTLCAMSRRKALPSDIADALKDELFILRTSIEKVIISCLPNLEDQESLIKATFTDSYFGVSAKQGVSIRYPLSTCQPTSLCSGRCYAHDGRDRELHILFRAVINWYIGHLYEDGSTRVQNTIIEKLLPSLNYGIDAAVKDCRKASEMGFLRAPRIRLAHIGDMAATPVFTNRLAWEIHHRASDVQCVAYTRHKNAYQLDPKFLIINFTIESDDDPRYSWIPSHARIVSSAWAGHLVRCASVNFLEHHVEKSAGPVGNGYICPVTAQHGKYQSCDDALCDLCFREPLSS